MITFHELTSAEYSNITPTTDGIYFIKDTGELYYNNVLYTDTLKINNNIIKTLQFNNIDFNYDEKTNQGTISVDYGTSEKAGLVKTINEIKTNSDTNNVVTENAVKTYVDNVKNEQKQYIDNQSTTLNDLKNNISIIGGNGINIETSNNNIIINNAHDSTTTTNSSLLIMLNGSNFQNDLYSVTYDNTNYKVQIKHNFNSRCIGIVYDQNNKQQNIGIDYIDDNNIQLQFTSTTLPNATKTKHICLGTVGCKQQYLFVSGSKPNLMTQYEHDEYGVVGKINDIDKVQFKGYNANGIIQLELWLVSNENGNIVLKIGQEKHLIYVTTLLQKHIITLNNRVKGMIEVSKDITDSRNQINSNVFLVDWTLYSENCKSLYLDYPYINNKLSGAITINAYNGLHQVVDDLIGDVILNNDNIINLKENETIKIRFQNINHSVVINNHYIDETIKTFYVVFTKINGEVKQIGDIVQVE